MPFLLDGNPSQGEISEAVNYLLSNFTQSVAADPNTGQVIGPGGEIQYYLYKYMFVKYADSFDGSVGFSDTPTNKGYYGLRNSDSSTESTNPVDYVWTQVSGGFGTTKFLYYLTTGGRAIQFQVATSVPNPGWVLDSGAAIDLDVTLATNSVANFVVIRLANNSAAPTDAECVTAIGRTPISGDLCTINYNSGIASITYKYTSGWAIFQKYITGDLIVADSIVGNNIKGGTITADKLFSTYIQVGGAAGDVNSGVTTINGGKITANSISADKLTASYIQVGGAASDVNSNVTTISGGKITAYSITANQMAADSITAANAAIADATVETLKIAGNAVTVPIANQYPEQIIRTFIVASLLESCGTLSSKPGYYVSIQGVEAGTPIYLQTTFSDQTEIYNPNSPAGIYPLIKYKLLRFHYSVTGTLLTTYTVSSLGEITITSNGAELNTWEVGPGVYGLSTGIVSVYTSRVFTYVDSSPTEAAAPIFQYFINGWGDDVSQGAGGLAVARCPQFTTFLLAAKR